MIGRAVNIIFEREWKGSGRGLISGVISVFARKD
jgi:hypothetical protein